MRKRRSRGGAPRAAAGWRPQSELEFGQLPTPRAVPSCSHSNSLSRSVPHCPPRSPRGVLSDSPKNKELATHDPGNLFRFWCSGRGHWRRGVT